MGSSVMDSKKTDGRKKWTRKRTTLRLNMPVSCPVISHDLIDTAAGRRCRLQKKIRYDMVKYELHQNI